MAITLSPARAKARRGFLLDGNETHRPRLRRAKHGLSMMPDKSDSCDNEIPFGTIHVRNPRLVELAKLLGRSVSSVSLKLANIARLDPVHQARGVKGMSHGAKGEAEVWREFAQDPEGLALESNRLLAQRLGKSLEEIAEVRTDDLPRSGIERDVLVKVRVNQSFFRRRILSAYNFRCCVTGLATQPLLNASHIVPWAEDAENRLNPKNGLCLNALHDRAFDRHLMWIEPGFVIRFAPSLLNEREPENEAATWLTRSEGQKLVLPKSFSPAPEFLAKHAAKCRAFAC
jgi:putative restriction endonuclease